MDARGTTLGMGPVLGDRAWPLGGLLAVAVVIRLVGIDQPIVENYVGRQIPTAMVARNLERGSGWLHPRLDTGPFPNYFVVEPPLYECGVVALRRATGMALEPSGRALSALAIGIAGWGLFDLIGRRGGARAAWLAVLAFTVFPLTIRYGRAFQPDAAMLGVCVAGLACWDRYRLGRGRPWLAAGWLLLALGFAIKVLAAFVLVPLVLVVLRRRRGLEWLAAGATLLPALLWYAWADHLVAGSLGSRASADNRAIWLSLLRTTALAQAQTWEWVVRCLLVRGFTPVGAILAVWGLVLDRRGGGIPNDPGRLWRVWLVAAAITLALVAAKLHHDYYFLLLAPAAAAGAGQALDRLAAAHRGLATAVAAGLVLLGGLQARSTWRVPAEWADLAAAAQVVATTVPPGAWLVAPEALLFQADRRGCRLEWTCSSARRAAGEWGAGPEVRDPLDLVDFYRRRGARYFADLGGRGDDPRRKGLHEAVRRRYKVIVDRPEVIIVDLVVAETRPHAH